MKFIFISLFFIFPFLSLGQYYVEITETGVESYKDVLSLKFEHAEVTIAAEKEIQPHNLYPLYLENYIDFLKVFISEEESLFNDLEDNKSKRINQIKKLDKDSPYRNYMLANIHLQWAVARLKFKEYFTAAIEINKAYRLLKENEEEFPDFVPNKISFGVLHIMIGMVPESYTWLLNLINMKGSVEQGRDELKFALENADHDKTLAYLKDETLFYLGFIDLNIKPDAEQLKYLLTAFQNTNSQNLLHMYLSASIYMRTGQNDKALRLLILQKELVGYYPFYYLEYLKGECYLRKLDYENSEKAYKVFLQQFLGKNYVKDANRKIGWAYLLSGNSNSYIQQMEITVEIGNDEVDIDKQAEKEAMAGNLPDINLLTARLLFDGGYYHKTDSVLFRLDEQYLNAEEKVEKIYRLGRSADQQNNISLAIKYYVQTIDLGKTLKRYFAGNAALKLAEIYEAENDIQKAIFYYQVCLNLEFDEFESSIHTKAKAGLKRVSD